MHYVDNTESLILSNKYANKILLRACGKVGKYSTEHLTSTRSQTAVIQTHCFGPAPNFVEYTPTDTSDPLRALSPRYLFQIDNEKERYEILASNRKYQCKGLL
jgi:hypothetical protein